MKSNGDQRLSSSKNDKKYHKSAIKVVHMPNTLLSKSSKIIQYILILHFSFHGLLLWFLMVFSCLFFCCWLTAHIQFYCMQKSCTNIPFNISFCALQEQKIIQVCNKIMVFFFKKQKLFLSPHLPKNTRWRNMKLSIYLFVHVIYCSVWEISAGISTLPPSYLHLAIL